MSHLEKVTEKVTIGHKRLTIFSMSQNRLQVNECVYEQNEGTAIGNPLSSFHFQFTHVQAQN